MLDHVQRARLIAPVDPPSFLTRCVPASPLVLHAVRKVGQRLVFKELEI